MENKIKNAYKVLNDDELRKIYDEYGEDGIKEYQKIKFMPYFEENYYQDTEVLNSKRIII